MTSTLAAVVLALATGQTAPPACVGACPTSVQFPAATSCAPTGEGACCWQPDSDTMRCGDGVGTLDIGAAGATGPAGATGIQGPLGNTGLGGPQGADGNSGPPGEPGAQGATGIAGPNGATGLAGPNGATGATGIQGPAGGASSWAGVLHGSIGDGDPIQLLREMNMLAVVGPTPTQVTTSVARCVGYRAPTAITVVRVRLDGVGVTTSLYKFGVYPRGTGAAKTWDSGTVTSAANTWLNITTNFTLSANTNYWFCVTTVNTGTVAGFRSPPAPLGTTMWGADAAPLGGRSLGLPVYVQFAVTAGAFPATLPAVAAAAYSGGTTGSVPFALFDSAP